MQGEAEAPGTPNLDRRLENSGKILTISAFIEYLKERGYLLAGAPLHTHIAGSQECWGTGTCPEGDNPDHAPPGAVEREPETGRYRTRRRPDTVYLEPRSTTGRELIDGFIGVDTREAAREMELLLERKRRERGMAETTALRQEP